MTATRIDPVKAGKIQTLRASVQALRDTYLATKLEYLRAQLELRLLQGDAVAVDRLARQVRNLIDTQRPTVARKGK
jgi:hypothetical protein